MKTEDELKAKIDNMSHLELCRHWRFAPIGDELLQGDVGAYFAEKLNEKGGFTPELSKAVGWDSIYR